MGRFAGGETHEHAGQSGGEIGTRFLPTEADVTKVLDECAVASEMAGEIQKTFDFFSATSGESSVDQLVLSGGCAMTPGLQEVLSERLGVFIELMDPLRRIQVNESDYDPDWLSSISPMLAVSVGLAARRLGD